MQFIKKYKILLGIAVITSLILLLALAALLFSYRSGYGTTGAYAKFSSCKQLSNYLADAQDTQVYPYPVTALEDGTKAQMGSVSGSINTYSQTNTQVQGIDELDTVKTNGKYLFKTTSNSVVIYDLDLNVVSELGLVGTPQGIYLNKNELVIVQNSYLYNSSFTRVETYNLNNIANPELINTISIDGNYFTSRVSNGNLVLVTNYYVNDLTQDIQALLPQIKINGQKDSPIDCNNVAYSGMPTTNFSVVTSLDLSNVLDYKMQAIVGSFDYVYVNKGAILLTQMEYTAQQPQGTYRSMGMTDSQICGIAGCPTPFVQSNKTIILKLVGNNKALDLAGSVTVAGRILDQFALDINQDFIRVATTGKDTDDRLEADANNVFIIDSNLNVVGSLTGLAAGEQVYSARFTPNTLYLVTYKQVDPFFTIDLTLPTAPKLIGQLKVPGYSEYLHPLDQDLILGTGVKGNQVQVSLFNVKDLQKPELVNSFQINMGSTTYSQANYDHTQLTFYPEKSLLALPINSYYPDSINTINLISYANKNIKDLGSVTACTQKTEEYYYTSDLRSAFVNNNLYTFCGTEVSKFDLNDLTRVKNITY